MEKSKAEELLQTIELKKRTEERIKMEEEKFDEATRLDMIEYDDLVQEEDKLRKEILQEFENEGKTSVDVNGHTITKSVRLTNKIESSEELANDIVKHFDIIKDICEIGQVDFDNAFEQVVIIKDKSLINRIINTYENVQGELLQGIKVQETKFLTVK